MKALPGLITQATTEWRANLHPGQWN